MRPDSPDLIERLRSEFPVKQHWAFLNHAAVAAIPRATARTIQKFAEESTEQGLACYGAWLGQMSSARTAAGRLLNCEPDDICFVKNTTHGILIVANSLEWRAGDNIVGLAHEFPANVHPWRNLAEKGVELRLVPERSDYSYDLDQIASAMDSRTRLLAVSWVEYSTGYRNDLEALGDLCRSRNVLLCVDAIQGLGVLPIDLAKLPIDFLTADGHKWLLGPEGCGLLYVNRDRIAEMNSSMLGWCGLKNPAAYDDYNQEYRPTARRFEEGSHALMLIAALGSSIQLLLDFGIGEVAARVEFLTDCLIAAVREKGYEVTTPGDFEHRAGIVAFRKDGVDPAALATALQQEHGVQVAARRGLLRVSPHFYNDQDELDRLVGAIP